MAAGAQPSPSARNDQLAQRLSDIQKKIEKENELLEGLRQKRQQFETEQSRVELDIENAQREKSDAENTLAELKLKLEDIEETVAGVERRIASRRDQMRSRLVAIYKMKRRISALDYLVQSSSVTEFLRRAHYFSIIAKRDEAILASLGSLALDLLKQRDELRRARDERESQVKKVAALENTLSAKREERAKIIAESRQQEEKGLLALKQLESSAARLEKLLAGVMGGEPAEPEPVPAPEPKAAPVPSIGRGLADARGKLPLPVDGEVIQRFGKQRHEEFSDILFVKGLEFHVAVGGKVRAVAAGRVVLNQVLPGYGNVVVLDHGKRYYSLYGRLATSMVKLGDLVDAGEALAVVGEPDHRERNFYFELRKEGKAVDPVQFFRTKLPQH